jgi:hypothetical protein
MVCVVVGGIRGLRGRRGLGWMIEGGRHRCCVIVLALNCSRCMIALDLLKRKGEVGYPVGRRCSLEASPLPLSCSRGQWPRSV